MHKTALTLLIIGGLNWGLWGLFEFDLVAAIFGGPDTLLADLVYLLVGVSALYEIYFWSRFGVGKAPSATAGSPPRRAA